jgi:hypothetical protein
MRVLAALAVAAVLAAPGFAGVTPAAAGDLSGFAAAGRRASPVVIYDDQPGVVVRAYWSAPWHNHHYYPLSYVRPRLGRVENLNAHRPAPKPAQSFHREWSNPPPYSDERPRARVVRAAPPPRYRSDPPQRNTVKP